MNDWQKTVAKFTKLHKGKSLTEILPLAKAEYRKTHKVRKIVKKHRNTKGHKKKQHGGNDHGTGYGSNDHGTGYGSTTADESTGDGVQSGGKRRKRRTKKSRKGKKAKKSYRRRH